MESMNYYCNKCFLLMNSNAPAFFLTQCGHIYCHICISKIGDHCPSCDSTGVQSMQLIAPLPPSISNMFTPLPQVYDHLGSIVKFQYGQFVILTAQADALNKKYNSLKSIYWDLRKRTEQMKQELHEIQEEYNNVKAEKQFVAHHQATIANNPQNQKYANVGNSYQYQMNANPAQNYSHNASHQQIPHPQNFQYSNDAGVAYGGYNTSDDSDSTVSTLRGSIPDTPVTPDGVFRIPNIRKAPRSKKSN
ncbi:zip homologous protein 1 [Microplitis demolitor]|uniref:zip homologous protein 1 n=1 Tax=Microplitis demolitor TaxID=69319 RepID=UPI00235B68F1|nr:zip homologous protein 1 [Microplitis demolitor]